VTILRAVPLRLLPFFVFDTDACVGSCCQQQRK
jgi:hypothetical protein